MEITSIIIKPEKKTADVWDAVTETEVQNNAGTDLPAHLKTYILNEKGAAVGKTETDFTVRAGQSVLAVQTVLTYSPVLGEPLYKVVCELYENGALSDKQEKPLIFPA
ncbi:MAG: hypothetical protein IJL81_04065 [Clostridia bacterium]|nr:hypothetical protein [Clostridia bacterium]